MKINYFHFYIFCYEFSFNISVKGEVQILAQLINDEPRKNKIVKLEPAPLLPPNDQNGGKSGWGAKYTYGCSVSFNIHEEDLISATSCIFLQVIKNSITFTNFDRYIVISFIIIFLWSSVSLSFTGTFTQVVGRVKNKMKIKKHLLGQLQLGPEQTFGGNQPLENLNGRQQTVRN